MRDRVCRRWRGCSAICRARAGSAERAGRLARACVITTSASVAPHSMPGIISVRLGAAVTGEWGHPVTRMPLHGSAVRTLRPRRFPPLHGGGLAAHSPVAPRRPPGLMGAAAGNVLGARLVGTATDVPGWVGSSRQTGVTPGLQHQRGARASPVGSIATCSRHACHDQEATPVRRSRPQQSPPGLRRRPSAGLPSQICGHSGARRSRRATKPTATRPRL